MLPKILNLSKSIMFKFINNFKFLAFISLISANSIHRNGTETAIEKHHLFKNPTLGKLPIMGWRSWQRFRCHVNCEEFPDDCLNEKNLKEIALRLAYDGWRDLGYNYLIVDDCWSALYRDPETEELQVDPVRFPNGIEFLVDFVHNLGLKFGLYANYGEFTCSGYPGSINYEYIDALTFSNWNIDLLHLDSCFGKKSNKKSTILGFQKFGEFIYKYNPNIMLSCNYRQATESDYTWLSDTCHLFKSSNEIDDSFNSVVQSVDYVGKSLDTLQNFVGDNFYYDADALLVANYGLTKWQAKTQITLWAMVSSPLMMSNDLTKIGPMYKQILTKPEILKINQMNHTGLRVEKITTENQDQYSEIDTSDLLGFDFWGKVLGENQLAIAITNTRSDGNPKKYKLRVNKILYKFPEFKFPDNKIMYVKDVWNDAPNKSGVPKMVKIDDEIDVYGLGWN